MIWEQRLSTKGGTDGFGVPHAVGLVWNAERMNTLAGRHWQRFARQVGPG